MLDIYVFEPDGNHLERLKEICIAYSVKSNYNMKIQTYDYIPESIDESLCGSEISLYMVKGSAEVHHLGNDINTLNQKNYTVLIVSAPSEVVNYISASLRPSGIIIKPADWDDTQGIIDDIINDYKKSSDNDTQFHFKIRSREFSVGMNSIVYFEAANKKIILYTLSQAFEFYMTIDDVLNKLDSNFIRVHKSYIINLNHVSVVDYKEMTVCFSDGSTAYISRTYKNALQEAYSRRAQL